MINSAATVQFGNGNVVTIGGVGSGESLTYIDALGNQTSVTLLDSDLTHAAGNLHPVAVVPYGTIVNMNNAIFNVASAAMLTMTGTSNRAILSGGGQQILIRRKRCYHFQRYRSGGR
ncbi:hypothetical protein [Paraburkholderia unamae]|uniref:hypothetical protein n=1 Tax=Paraburkholderia unamae TaxID=219649 RepID=UPI0010582CAD|nr:hypothetical protein [Paraburkholderia unamae]